MLKVKALDRLDAALREAAACYRAGLPERAIGLLAPLRGLDRNLARKWRHYDAGLQCLAASYALRGQFGDALAVQAELLALSPLDHQARAHFLQWVLSAGTDLPSSQILQKSFLKMLDREDVNKFAVPGAFALLRDGKFKAGMDQVSRASGEELVDLLRKGQLDPLLESALLLRLMRETVIPHPDFERLFLRLRKAILQAAGRDDVSYESRRFFKRQREFTVAFAQYLWTTEYALFVDDEEDEGLKHLEQEIESGLSAFGGLSERLLLCLVVFALYAPWDALRGSDVLFGIPVNRWPSHLRPLLREWLDCREERGCLDSIPALTPIAEGTSEMVRAQYEENPYPRWKHIPPQVEQISLARLLRHLAPEFVAPERFEEPVDLLLAGCGTGIEAINLYRQIKTRSFLAVDLSRASLAYALGMARKLGNGAGIEFCQADINRLDSLDRTFDVIVSRGVLHHLENPMAGWRILVDRLRPGGVMCIALYSALAGQTVMKARALIERNGWTATPERMRRFRMEILDGRHEELTLLPNWADFYRMSMFRDLVFHVNEHRFTFPQIKQWLHELGLRLLCLSGLNEGTVVAYRRMFPDDPAMTDLERWGEFEEKYPLTFVGMYEFFAEKV